MQRQVHRHAAGDHGQHAAAPGVGQHARGRAEKPRIGQRAYIRPGGAFAGGTLARDVTFLTQLASRHGLSLPMLQGVIPSNEQHRRWPFNQLTARLGELTGRRIAVLGLTYKPDTSALRRSPSIALTQQLRAAGAVVAAHGGDVRSEAVPGGVAFFRMA